jgi:hypothetical protein
MNNQAEHDMHVEYVASELMKFRNSRLIPGYEEDTTNNTAHDILQWVTSTEVDRWRDFKIWTFGYFVGAALAILSVLVLQTLRTQ